MMFSSLLYRKLDFDPQKQDSKTHSNCLYEYERDTYCYDLKKNPYVVLYLKASINKEDLQE